MFKMLYYYLYLATNMIYIHFKFLQSNLRVRKGGTITVDTGRYLAALRYWLAGTGFLIFTGKPNDNVTVSNLTKHIDYVFYKFHVYFS